VPRREYSSRAELGLVCLPIAHPSQRSGKSGWSSKAIPIDAKICDKLVESKGLNFDPFAETSIGTVFDQNIMGSTTSRNVPGQPKMIPFENLCFILNRTAADITGSLARTLGSPGLHYIFRPGDVISVTKNCADFKIVCHYIRGAPH
jgi:hypothetical protein